MLVHPSLNYTFRYTITLRTFQSSTHIYMMSKKNQKVNTVKPVNKDHPRETKHVVFAERWSLFRGQFLLELTIWGFGNMVLFERWSLFGGCLSSRFDCIDKCRD